MERAYRESTRLLGAAICLLGVAMIVTTLVRGGGPLTLGVIAGLALALLGAGRAFLAGGRPPSRRDRA